MRKCITDAPLPTAEATNWRWQLLTRKKPSGQQPDKPEYALHLQHIKAAELVQRCQKMVENRKDVTKSELYQAVSHLKSAVAMDPLYAQAYVWLALVYSELDEHARAISTLKEVISLYPQESGLQHIMEELKQRLKSYMQDTASD